MIPCEKDREKNDMKMPDMEAAADCLKGYIHSTESFGTVDGPGIRFVVFFQGCPMRCLYCHNPDTWKMKAASQMTVEEILTEYEKNREFYHSGGLTCTGGEPLMQLDFLTELFRQAHERGIHTCLDTSGIVYRKERREQFLPLAAVTDLVLLDIKHGDEKAHKNLTGRSGQPAWEFLAFLEEQQVPVWIRHVLVPGITDGREDLKLLGRRLTPYKNIKALDILPYHRMGEAKYEELEMEYPLKGLAEPSPEDVKRAKEWILEGLSAK